MKVRERDSRRSKHAQLTCTAVLCSNPIHCTGSCLGQGVPVFHGVTQNPPLSLQPIGIPALPPSPLSHRAVSPSRRSRRHARARARALPDCAAAAPGPALPLPEARQRAGLRPQALPRLGPARSPMLTEKYTQHISVVCSHGLNFICHV
jgi:hypothetical protein